MHDLMHDLAQEVARDEIIVTNTMPNNLSKKIRHLFINGEVCTKSSFQESNIHTCYMNSRVPSDVVKSLIGNLRFLRSLRLYLPDAEYLPESIGQLLHLRYLDLSESIFLKTLPNSISKLYNLQSLNLQVCVRLKEWPTDFCKLVNLRLLDISGCLKLTCMPSGIGQLSNLHDLTDFKVGGVSSTGKQFGGQLKDLKLFVNLRGMLTITVEENLAIEKENIWEGGYLEHINCLKAVRMYFPYGACEINIEALIEKLQPNRNLMELTLCGYKGTEIPRWGKAQDDWSFILPNLVSIVLQSCERLDGIPLLSNLKHLKSLSLWELNNLEYMETNEIGRGGSGSKDLLFFPSLKLLEIVGLRRLKGWWEGIGEGDGSSSCMPHWQPPFPCLSNLFIESCPELTSLPPCPTLEFLMVSRSNKLLRILPGQGSVYLDLKLNVEVDSVGYLTTLPARDLSDIVIQDDDEVKSLSEVEEVFKSASSLRKLGISGCRKLTSVSGVLEHLTALESLSLSGIPVVDEEFVDDMPWRSLCHNLRSLKFESLDTLQMLPRGLKHLTALENLSIEYCYSLEGLPEWIRGLSSLHSLTIESCTGLNSLGTIQNITSLQKLEILNCPDLREACEESSGKEWPNIRHIPHISFTISSLDSSDSD